MNTQILDFLRNVSDQNLVNAKENITVALSQKVRDVLKQKEVEVRDSIYNGKQEEE